MASKTVATKSHKKSHTGKASTTMEGCKKTGHVQKKTAAAMASEAQQSEASDDEPEEPLTDATAHRAPAQVVWDKYPVRTDRLLDYLDAHSNVAIKLFGDSTKVAKSEGRFKLTAKSNKSAGYLQVAEGIFSIDEDAAYAKAVDNYITNILKKRYRAANECIGTTGAGLKPGDATPGSEIANIIELETQKFRWWPRLHGYWQTLPNFNPYTVSSDPGQDLADQAYSVLLGDRGHADSEMDEHRLPDLGNTDTALPDDDNIAPVGRSTPSPAKPNHSRHNSLASSAHKSFRAISDASSRTPSSSQKSKAMTKHSLQDVFAEGSKTLDKQHQREQHEFRMMEMWMRMRMSQNQNQQGMPMATPSSQLPYEGLGLMAELNDAILPPGDPFPQQYAN
ncbi:hypothetical protein DFH94DRAFT_699523 [Russula ochroleuca]|uniref:Uncharacterized protein n=1 Tax=Russula ochroleuca TaxID=152965 RepID=A0A9P5MN61_9AGAM|nr:hypothetical protein DFH94DRAFT_699523 [Russula ochroleuca]